MNLKTNAFLSLAGSVVPALAALAFVPGTLSRMGNDAFGVLTLLLALIGYFSIFDLGMARGLTFRLAQLHATEGAADSRRQQLETPAVLGTGMFITLLAGALGAVAVLALAPLIVTRGVDVPQHLQSDALRALQWVAAGMVFVTFSSATRGALEGINQFRIANINKAVVGAGTFAVPWAVVQSGSAMPLTHTAAVLVVLRLAVCVLEASQVLRLTRSRLAQMRPRMAQARQLLNYGGWILVSNVLSPLMVYGDRFVIGGIVGTYVLPYYAIPQEGLQRFLVIPSALCSALMPRLSQAARGEFVRLLRKSEAMNVQGMLALCAVIALGVHPFLSWWISKDFADVALWPSMVMVVGMFFNADAMVKYVALHALGQTRLTAIVHAVEFVVYFAALVVLTRQFGILGAAVAWTARVVVDNLVLRILLRRQLRKADNADHVVR